MLLKEPLMDIGRYEKQPGHPDTGCPGLLYAFMCGFWCMLL